MRQKFQNIEEARLEIEGIQDHISAATYDLFTFADDSKTPSGKPANTAYTPEMYRHLQDAEAALRNAAEYVGYVAFRLSR